MAAAIGIAKTATEIFLGVGEISIDNFTFKLFYKWTVTMLIVCSVLVSTSQFFGDPIQCETAEDSVDDDVLNAYCWMYSSFDIPPSYEGTCTRKRVDSTHLYNTYYQWVSIFLGTQAVLFYIPRCLWLMLEGGLMAFLLKGTTGRVVEDSDEKKSGLLRHFQEHIHNKFNRYAFGFFLCEFMNLCVVIIAFLSTHGFLNYEFLSYGIYVYRYYSLPVEERLKFDVVNPLCEVFPKITACNYIRYGMGGARDSRHAICILGQNMINDKVFLFIWVWYVLLILASVVRLVTRSTQMISAKVRFFLMRLKMHHYFQKTTHMKHIQHYVLSCSIGDWFILYQISKNVNKRFFVEFVALLALTVNPDPNDPVFDEPEIHFTQEEIDKLKKKSSTWSKLRRRMTLVNDQDGDEDEEDGGHKNIWENTPMTGMDVEMEVDTTLNTGGPGGSLSDKQKTMYKRGKETMSAKQKAKLAQQMMKRKGKRR